MQKLESGYAVSKERCRCCAGATSYFSTARILDFTATYSKCAKCASVQADNPTWIEKAHSKAISNLDTGLVSRCFSASRLISTLLFLEGKRAAEGIDWGGGTGLLTRLLRDQGFEVRSYDKYARAEHAEGFEATLKEAEETATFITSVECFEHLINPVDAYKEVTSKKEYFIFTTEIIDTPPPDPAEGIWWYFVPESGQHITFASKQGLDEFRKILGFDNYVRFGSLQVMSRSRLKLTTRFVLGIRVIRSLAILFIPEFLNRRFSLALSDKADLTPKSF
ncbi:MAG: methyltransferase domain-containing protein [Actinobacteria bacterium]|nr:methyltransferase domain-containing protein [Actinomycetota bacterium]